MADASALAGLLDRARNVFLLAHRLGGDFYRDFESRSPGDQSPQQRHRKKIKEFIDAALEFGAVVESPPAGFNAVAKQLRKAGQLAGQLADPKVVNILGMYPELNTAALYGYEAIKSARSTMRPNDPFAVFNEPKVSETSAVGEAIAIGPTLEEIRDKIQSTRERTRHPNALHNPNQMADDAHNDLASIVRLLDKCGIPAPSLPDHRLHPQQIIDRVLKALDDVELALNHADAPADQPLANTSVVQDYRSLGEILLDLSRCETAQATGQRVRAVELRAKLHLDGDAGRIEALCKARHGAFTIETANKFCGEVCSHHDLSDYDAKRLLPGDFIGLAKQLPTVVEKVAHGVGALVDDPRARLLNPDISDAIADADRSAYRPSEVSAGTKTTRRGRRKADYETQQREAKLVADWKQAHESGVCKADFAKQKGLKPKDLNRLLDRVAWRNRPSE